MRRGISPKPRQCQQRQHAEDEGRDVPALAADLVDQEGTHDGCDDTAGRRRESVGKAGLQRQFEHFAVERRQPGDETVGDHVDAEPQRPDRQGAPPIDALEQFAPVAVAPRSGLRRDDRR